MSALCSSRGLNISCLALIALGFIITVPLMQSFNDDDHRMADHRVTYIQSEWLDAKKSNLKQTSNVLVPESLVGQTDNHQQEKNAKP